MGEKDFISTVLLTLVFLFGTACRKTPSLPHPDPERFIKEKCLYVALESSPSDYFLYRGQPMGFELELIESFAGFIGCDFVILPGKSLAGQWEMLKDGRADIIASNLNITDRRLQEAAFSHPVYFTEQVLVQLQPAYMMDSSLYVTDWNMLAGKTITVRRHSIFEENLQERNKNLPEKEQIHIEGSAKTEEELLDAVSRGNMPYTLVSYNKAARFAITRPQIDFHLKAETAQPVAWAMRQDADTLLVLVNRWLDSLSHTGTIGYLYHKYYEISPEKTVRSVKSGFRKVDSVSLHRKMAQREMLVREGMLEESDSTFIFELQRKKPKKFSANVWNGGISPFDRLLKKYSRKIPWDWRLLASLVYQESQFESHLVSKKGAIGLMQMIPATARRYGITVRSSAEEQIEAGVKYIHAIYLSLPKEIPETEQAYFVLAAYNIGLGHILDARRLAAKYGADPNIWYNNVETYLELKSRAEYYRDTASRNGYANGRQAVDFVRKIDKRYMHYRNLAK